MAVPLAFGAIQHQASGNVESTTTLPSFDVVSIKPSKSGCVLTVIGPSSDGFHLNCMPLSGLIRYAYGYGVFQDERVMGEPSWIKSVSYDIDAKLAASDVDAFGKLAPEQKASMLQTVLKERFNLTVHDESRELPVYALVVAKEGSRLKESIPDDPATKGLPLVRMKGRGQMEAHRCPIKTLLMFLSPLEGRTVVDQTGLTGRYEFTLHWMPEPMARESVAEDSSEPSIFTAVQEQLGLKLVPSKAPQKVLVVDHVEKPSEN